MLVLPVTYFECYNGAMKDVDFKRRVLYAASKQTREVEDYIQIEVKPGYSEETVLRFPKRGHEAFGAHQSDLVIKFSQIEQEGYSRQGDNIIYHHTCDLAESFDPKPISIALFDSTTVSVTPPQ